MPYNAQATEALFNAVNSSSVDAALKALDDGADPNGVQGVPGNSPLMICALHHLPEVSKALLEKGADPDYQRKGGETALMMCALSNDRKTAKLIVDAGANVLLQDNANRDAMMHTISQGNRALGDMIVHWAEQRRTRLAEEQAEAERQKAAAERVAAELRQNIADIVSTTADGLHTAVQVKRPLRLREPVHG